MKRTLSKLIITMIIFSGLNCYAINPDDINQVVDACVVQVQKDSICEFLFQVKGVGTDAVEAIKVFFKLTPRDYAILTVANMAATGRIRFQTKSFLHENMRHTFDFKKDFAEVTIEMKF